MLKTGFNQSLSAPVIWIASRGKKFPRCPVWIGQAAQDAVHKGGELLGSMLEIEDIGSCSEDLCKGTQANKLFKTGITYV